MVPSHCLYAYDVLIFCKGTQSSVKCIMKQFQLYGEFSGLKINCNKSKIYDGAMTK